MTTPQSVINAYLDAYRYLYGEEALRRINLHYSKWGGWYYLRHRIDTGRLGWIDGKATPYRRKAIEEMTQRLKERRKALDNPPHSVV